MMARYVLVRREVAATMSKFELRDPLGIGMNLSYLFFIKNFPACHCKISLTKCVTRRSNMVILQSVRSSFRNVDRYQWFLNLAIPNGTMFVQLSPLLRSIHPSLLQPCIHTTLLHHDNPTLSHSMLPQTLAMLCQCYRTELLQQPQSTLLCANHTVTPETPPTMPLRRILRNLLAGNPSNLVQCPGKSNILAHLPMHIPEHHQLQCLIHLRILTAHELLLCQIDYECLDFLMFLILLLHPRVLRSTIPKVRRTPICSIGR